MSFRNFIWEASEDQEVVTVHIKCKLFLLFKQTASKFISYAKLLSNLCAEDFTLAFQPSLHCSLERTSHPLQLQVPIVPAQNTGYMSTYCSHIFLESRDNMNWLDPLLYVIRLSYHVLVCHRYSSNLILSRDSNVAILSHRLGYTLFLLKDIQ